MNAAELINVSASTSAAGAVDIMQVNDEITSTLTVQGLGSNPGEDMDVCKCIAPLRHGGTLNSRRATSHLVWLVEREER
ncbi:hypothetical protein TNCV_4172141 [Trichonephila clavipes]|nr:hypothetical protein TNCV_4172141 [Trichonephila clavipes]